MAAVALSTFQSLSPFYLAAKADQLGMVSDNIAQTLISSHGNPSDWGDSEANLTGFQLGLEEYNLTEYPNTGGVGLYSLDPTKLSRLSSSNPYFIPYSSYYSGFSEEILDLDSDFYNMSPSENNALSSLGLSNYRFRLVTRPPYQLNVTAGPYQLSLYPFESSWLFQIESLTWNDVPIPEVQYSFAIMGPKGFVTKFMSGGKTYQVFSGVTNASGEDAVSVKIKFSPKQPQGVYVITAISRTATGLVSFCFTPFNIFVIDPAFKVVAYTRRTSSYSSQVVAHIWDISQTDTILINSTLQSQRRIHLKATVFQPNGSVIGPSDMSYNADGFWTYDYPSPLVGPYLSFVSVYSVNITIYNALVDFVERILKNEASSAKSVSWSAVSMWLAYYYTGEFLDNATRQISKEKKQLGYYEWWKWSYDYVSLCTYAYTLAYWATDQVHDDWLYNATNYGGNTLVDDYSKWANDTVVLNSYATLALSMLYIATGNSTYLDLAVKAAAWLEDNWDTGPYDSSEATYDVGAAIWSLMTLYQATGVQSYYNLAQTMAYWVAVRQNPDGSWPGSSVGGGNAEYTSLPLIGLCSTWNYTFYENVTAGLNWLITTKAQGTMSDYKLAAAVMASGYCNAYVVPPSGWVSVSYPMMADYGPSDLPYEDTVRLTRYVTIHGTVYQAILHCWDPEIETSKAVLSVSCLSIGILTACPMVVLILKKAKKRGFKT